MSTPISENSIGTISHFFVSNRPLSILILVVAITFGLLSFWLLPKQYNPEIIRPAFAITLEYQGATIAEARDRVLYELNEKIQTVPGVDEVMSTVYDGARIETTVIFTVGYDATKAKVDLLTQLEQHSYLARGYIQPPQVREINPETIPVLHIVFSTDTAGLDTLRTTVTRLSHTLAGVPGVSEMEVAGGYTPALVLELDPAALASRDVATEDVARVLQTHQTRLVTDGVETGQNQLQMVFDGQASTVDAVGLLPIRGGVMVRDVALVYEGTAGSRSYILNDVDGQLQEVVTLAVAKVEGASAPVVTSAFLAQLDTVMMTESYQEISYTVVSNDGATATAEIAGLLVNLITSIGIVAVVLLLFLSTRAAVVVLVAIPTTLIVVFGIGYLFDQTINRITLFALILSLGLLVDSAIVVVENIHAHLKEWRRSPAGVSRERAVAGAVHELGIGLVLSTVTSVIVFLPMLYITGMMGPYMGPIAFFVPVALLVSLAVAVVVVPFAAAHILDPDEQPRGLARVTNRLMEKMTSGYERFLRKVLTQRTRQRRLLRGALVLFVVSLLLPALGLVHFQMLPKADRDQLYVYIDAAEGTNVEATRRLAAEVSAVLQQDEDILSIQQFVAAMPMLDFNGLFKGAPSRVHPHQATLRVNLTPAAERNRSSTEITTDLRRAISADTPAIAPMVRLLEDPPGPPVAATFVAKFQSEDADLRNDVARDFIGYVQGISGVVDIDSNLTAPASRIRYSYDSVAGATLGVTPDTVVGALRLLSDPQPVGEYLGSAAIEYTPVLMALPPAVTADPNSITGLSVRSSTGALVPLASVVTTQTEARPAALHFEDAAPLTTVTAEVEGRSIVYVVIEVMYGLIRGDFTGYRVSDWNLFSLTLVTETGEMLTLDWGGEWEMTLENFRDLGIAMGVALALVYAVLVAQYRRFSVPGYILVTVPLALIGILWGFFVLDAVFGIYLTATALIGFIALIGIVVNNAIIYLEYVEQLEHNGQPYVEALIMAGRARLRPIVLTSLTTVLGSLTIASDPVWSGLAWAIVFGLSLSTILTLVVYPTLLVYFRKT